MYSYVVVCTLYQVAVCTRLQVFVCTHLYRHNLGVAVVRRHVGSQTECHCLPGQEPKAQIGSGICKCCIKVAWHEVVPVPLKGAAAAAAAAAGRGCCLQVEQCP
jgi:hypothetical protein